MAKVGQFGLDEVAFPLNPVQTFVLGLPVPRAPMARALRCLRDCAAGLVIDDHRRVEPSNFGLRAVEHIQITDAKVSN
jgi:hypothetical protein